MGSIALGTFLQYAHLQTLCLFSSILQNAVGGRLCGLAGNKIEASLRLLEDLTNLASAYDFPSEFNDPKWTSMATKLRVVETIAPDW